MNEDIKTTNHFLFRTQFIFIGVVYLTFFVISYFLFQAKLVELKNRSQRNFNIIKNEINTEISNAHHVIYSLAITLLHDFALKDKKRVQEIVEIFDPQLKRSNFPSFSGFKILGKNNELIAISTHNLPFILYKKEEDPKYLQYVNKVKKHPFELHVDAIRTTRKRNLEIIPIGMAIVGPNGEYIGTILSGLLTSKLNAKLNKLLSYFDNIKLFNPTNPTVKNYQTIEYIFSIKNLILYLIKDEPMMLYHQLSNYPISVEAEIKFQEFYHEFNKIGLFCLLYFMLISFILYVFYNKNINFFYKILHAIGEKSELLSSLDCKLCKNVDIDKNASTSNAIKLINCIIDSYHSMCLNYKKEKIENSLAVIKEKISSLVLKERHYISAIENCDNLVKNQLTSLINETYKTDYLSNYLTKIINYCSEYFHELAIYTLPLKNDRTFLFKSAALNETLFSIFKFIARMEAFNIVSEKITVSTYFHNEASKLPNIIIKVSIIISEIEFLDKNYELDYAYSGLLPIYLLAKENDLFFHFKQDGQYFTFILEPIHDEKVENIMEYIDKLTVSNIADSSKN